MELPFLPYGKQDITETDKQAVLASLDDVFLTTGPKVGQFEQAFATYCGAREGVALSNGTAALHLAAVAMGIGQGDCVLAPTMSFAASANGAAYTGARIDFMDCDPETGLVTPEIFAEAVDRAKGEGRSPRLAVVVHLNGELADMKAIYEVAETHGIALMEDSCHALGSKYRQQNGGEGQAGDCRFCVAASWSTHPVKTITTGEGGVLTSNDEEFSSNVRLLRSHGITREAKAFETPEMAFEGNEPNPWYYEMQNLGYNYRLTDIACALGLSQLSRMDAIAARRREMKRLYDSLFAQVELPLMPVRSVEGCDAVRHLYPVLIDFDVLGKSRRKVMLELREAGIGTQVHYIPIHRQPYYARMGQQELKGADHYYARCLSLPFYVGLKDEDISRVVETLGRVIKR